MPLALAHLLARPALDERALGHDLHGVHSRRVHAGHAVTMREATLVFAPKHRKTTKHSTAKQRYKHTINNIRYCLCNVDGWQNSRKIDEQHGQELGVLNMLIELSARWASRYVRRGGKRRH